jgi:Xaa-Pro aminopeptidase
MHVAHDFALNKERRKLLAQKIKEQYPSKQGVVVLFAGFEDKRSVFRQESSFYYMTGIREPGVVLVMDLGETADIYIPNCDQERAKWMSTPLALTQKNATYMGIANVRYLGDQCSGYTFHPFFPQAEYQDLVGLFEVVIKQGGVIFTLTPNNPSEYAQQRALLERIKQFVPALTVDKLVDISPLIAEMRRTKGAYEIATLYKAVEVTALAQEAACEVLEDGVLESEVQASLEYMFTASQARIAFPSIVASGKNSTILHYHDNNASIRNGDLIVVDIGAEYDYYCADITRTYPVSGEFTKRQREVYNVVLETQAYIASIAKPGMWLNYKEKADQSLNHLAKRYLQERGYGQYFPHGIGHFLGLDVHDVGDYSKPLQEGDVITIEPGIYIPQEQIGIRIEDDYWLVNDGVVCLSEDIPKDADEIEAMAQRILPDQTEDDEDAYDDDDDGMMN